MNLPPLRQSSSGMLLSVCESCELNLSILSGVLQGVPADNFGLMNHMTPILRPVFNTQASFALQSLLAAEGWCAHPTSGSLPGSD